MTYCQNCRTTEGETEFDMEAEETVCAECGEPVTTKPDPTDWKDDLD